MNRPYKKIPVALFGYALCVSQFVAGCDDGEPNAGEGGVGGGVYATGPTGTVPGAVAGATGRYATGTKAGVGGSTGKVTAGGTGGKPATATTGKVGGTGGSKPTSSSKPTTGGSGNTGGSASKGGSGGKSSTGGTSAKGGSSSIVGGPTVKPVVNGQTAKTTRYWDCCKPSCAWPGKGSTTMKSCGKDGTSSVDANAKNACSDNGPAFTCYSYAPWAVSETLSYGFAATNSDANCGKCYQLDFTGGALQGKSMIVQATNMGGDVSSNHFDLLIPGGGVGIFNGCSTQWNKDASALGQQWWHRRRL